jgi:hypothetical protein
MQSLLGEVKCVRHQGRSRLKKICEFCNHRIADGLILTPTKQKSGPQILLCAADGEALPSVDCHREQESDDIALFSADLGGAEQESNDIFSVLPKALDRTQAPDETHDLPGASLFYDLTMLTVSAEKQLLSGGTLAGGAAAFRTAASHRIPRLRSPSPIQQKSHTRISHSTNPQYQQQE